MAEQPQQFHQGSERPRERQGGSQQPGGMGGSEYQQAGAQYQSGRANASPDSAGSARRGDQGNGVGRGSMSIPGIAFRGIGRLCDMQMAATRLMLQTQASAACALGMPDYSGLFRIADDRAKRVFSSGAEQLLQLAERTNETTSEIQREMGRLLEVQTVNEAENWQRGLEELGAQAEESLEEFKEMARQQAEEALRIAEQFSQESREAMRQGGETAERQGEAAGRHAEGAASAGEESLSHGPSSAKRKMS